MRVTDDAAVAPAFAQKRRPGRWKMGPPGDDGAEEFEAIAVVDADEKVSEEKSGWGAIFLEGGVQDPSNH